MVGFTLMSLVETILTACCRASDNIVNWLHSASDGVTWPGGGRGGERKEGEEEEGGGEGGKGEEKGGGEGGGEGGKKEGGRESLRTTRAILFNEHQQ